MCLTATVTVRERVLPCYQKLLIVFASFSWSSFHLRNSKTDFVSHPSGISWPVFGAGEFVNKLHVDVTVCSKLSGTNVNEKERSFFLHSSAIT